jgi:hypothetical protein
MLARAKLHPARAAAAAAAAVAFTAVAAARLDAEAVNVETVVDAVTGLGEEKAKDAVEAPAPLNAPKVLEAAARA